MSKPKTICKNPKCVVRSKDEFTPPIYDTPLISIAEAKRFISDCFVAAGASDYHAQEQAELLAHANQCGVFTHGMNRLDMYIEALLSGQCNGKAMPKILKESSATAWVDGMNTFGAVVGNFCMDLAITKAKDVGIGFVVACNSNHYGMASWYASKAYRKGLIGLSGTNSSPLMAPTRAKKVCLGTNPISLVCPSIDDNCTIDMATTTVAVGKLEMKRKLGEPYPVGWAQDLEGNPHIDSNSSEPYALLPLGGTAEESGHKGYCLSLLVEILSGILGGGNFGPFIPPFRNPDAEHIRNLGQFFMAIDPNFFAPCFEDRMDTMMKYLRNMEPINPLKPVLVPGDPEKKFAEHVKAMGGVHYLPNQMESCNHWATKLNVLPMQGLRREMDED